MFYIPSSPWVVFLTSSWGLCVACSWPYPRKRHDEMVETVPSPCCWHLVLMEMASCLSFCYLDVYLLLSMSMKPLIAWVHLLPCSSLFMIFWLFRLTQRITLHVVSCIYFIDFIHLRETEKKNLVCQFTPQLPTNVKTAVGWYLEYKTKFRALSWVGSDLITWVNTHCLPAFD